MADGIIKVAARLRDWKLLDKAIRLKIADQRKFIDKHWDPRLALNNAKPKLRPSGSVVSLSQLEAASGIRQPQVSRWRAGLRDEAAYHAEIARAARVAAGLEESERAKRDAEAKRRRRQEQGSLRRYLDGKRTLRDRVRCPATAPVDDALARVRVG